MTVEKIKALLNTLNAVEVRGRVNHEAILGCIYELEKELQEIAKQQSEV